MIRVEFTSGKMFILIEIRIYNLRVAGFTFCKN